MIDNNEKVPLVASEENNIYIPDNNIYIPNNNNININNSGNTSIPTFPINGEDQPIISIPERYISFFLIYLLNNYH